MKKILALFAAVMIFMTAAIPAFADMDSPAFTAYEAYIAKEGGADTYEFNWYEEERKELFEKTGTVIPMGEKVEIVGEFIVDGVYYGRASKDDFYGYILLSDISNEKPELSVENAYKLEKPETVVVINPDGVYLRSGPSMTYDVVSKKIEFGTVLTYELVNDEYFASWAYITHNGESGWLYTAQYGMDNIYNCAYLVSENNDEYYDFNGTVLTVDDGLQLTETPDEDSNKVSKKIPAGTELTFEWFFKLPKSVAVYVEYEGVKGWLIADQDWGSSASTSSDMQVFVYAEEGEKFPVYDFPKGEKTGEYLSGGETVSSDYSVETVYTTDDGEDFKIKYTLWYRVDINGKTGWIVDEEDDEFEVSVIDIHPEGTLYLFEDMPVYNKAGDKSSKTENVVPKDTEVLCIKSFDRYYGYNDETEEYQVEESWYYVDCNGLTGWIVDDDKIESVADSRLSTRLGDWRNTRYALDANIYESYSVVSPVISHISEDTVLEEIYEYSVNADNEIDGDETRFVYVEYNGIKGWIEANRLLYESDYRNVIKSRGENNLLSDEEFEEVFDEQVSRLNERLTEAETTEAETTEAEQPAVSSASPKTVIIGCVAGGIILGLTAFVVIVLINKKKKSA